MPGVQDAVEVLSQIPTATNRLSTSDFETSDSVAGERSRIATKLFRTAVAVQEGTTFDVDLVAYESFTTNATAGDTETFNLSNNLIDAASVADTFVLYENGTEVQPDSVDYSNDSFTYTDDATGNNLHVFYTAGDQAHVEVRKTAPNGTYEILEEGDVGLINRRDQNKSPLEFDFDHPLQGVIPTDWRLDVYVDGPYTIDWGIDTDGDGEDEAVASNQLLSVPIERSDRDIPDWAADVVAQVASTR